MCQCQKNTTAESFALKNNSMGVYVIWSPADSSISSECTCYDLFIKDNPNKRMKIIILQEAVMHQLQAVTFGSLTVCQYRTIERIAKRILNRISCRNRKIGNFYTTATGNYRQRLLSVIRLHRLHALYFNLFTDWEGPLLPNKTEN